MEGSSFHCSRDRAVEDERVCRWGKSDILYLLNWEQMLNVRYFPGLLTLSHLKKFLSSKSLCSDFKVNNSY